MGYIGNGVHGAIVYRDMGYRGYRPHGQWGNSIQGVWGTGHMGNGAHRVMITGGMGHMDNGTHGLWGTGVWGT